MLSQCQEAFSREMVVLQVTLLRLEARQTEDRLVPPWW